MYAASRELLVTGFLLLEGFALMSYASAIEPLRAANILARRKLYEWRHFSIGGAPATASNGVSVAADGRVGDDSRLDALFVCAGGSPAAFEHGPTLAWLRGLSQRGVRIGGISGGPYVLARAGLLNGHRCTIHWEHAPALAEEFPELDIRHTLYEIDRDRLTCAGGIAALDMMIDQIERDHGAKLGAAVSEWHLRTQVRPAGSSQRMPLSERFGVSSEKVLRALAFMEAHLEEPASVEDLAAAAGSTVRQLQRLFVQHLGHTPMRQYLLLRLERSQVLLRQTAMPRTEVALACGFASPNHFSRAYKAHFGRSPGEERQPAARGRAGWGTGLETADDP
jgi:transcriptional regulator GlxA family with amidase domain